MLKQNDFSISHNTVLKTEVNADSKVITEEKELVAIAIDSEAITKEERRVTVVDSDSTIEE